MLNSAHSATDSPLRRKWLPALSVAAALGLAAPAAAQPDSPWLHVRVHDESGNAKVEVNLPLAAVEALSGAMAEEALRDALGSEADADEPRPDFEDLRALWRALRAEPGAWVSVDDDDGQLRARMEGDEVRITAAGDDGSLNIRFPTAVGDALFEEGREDIDFAAAVRRLQDHDGDLVVVDGDDGGVRIWIGPQ